METSCVWSVYAQARSLSVIGSRFDTTLNATGVLGTLTGLSISVYDAQGALSAAGVNPLKFGVTGVKISNLWTNDTSVVPTAVGTGVANITQVTMRNLAGSPIVTSKLYDALGGRLFQSQGVIMQTPYTGAGGVSGAGVYGLMPFIQASSPMVTTYTEWVVR